MTTYELLSLIVPAIIGTIQCGLIYYGLYVMRAASKERADDMDQRHAEAMGAHEEAMGAMRAAHDESMAALKTLIERTAR